MNNSDIRELDSRDREALNRLAPHPLQSWEWGEFRKKTGLNVLRLGRFEKNRLRETVQMTIHPIPHTPWNIGYIPKSRCLSPYLFHPLVQYGHQNQCVFIKFEPAVRLSDASDCFSRSPVRVIRSSHPLFPSFTFELDLTASEEVLLARMHPKTRYNIRVAQKHGVTCSLDHTPEAFQTYLELTDETTKRQKFYAHTPEYHRMMFETLGKAGIAYLFTATFPHDNQKDILSAWIVFLFNSVLYYPYGASSVRFRNVMANNLLMWEIIRWGKERGARRFDMWGSMGPHPDPSDPWYGFHRFKQGYGPELVEWAGSFDMVLNPGLYRLYRALFSLRSFWLKIRRG